MAEGVTFAERLNRVREALDVSQTELAQAMGCGRSNVSRMCNGVRVPRAGGDASRRVVRALCVIATKQHLVERLEEVLDDGGEASGDLDDRLMRWLFEGTQGQGRSLRLAGKSEHDYFGERLGAAMKLADFSNARLGRQINVDASYVSRFRNGKRTPRSNPAVMDALVEALYERLRKLGRLDQLAELMGVDARALGDADDAAVLMGDWLYGTAEGSEVRVNRLLQSIAHFSPGLDFPDAVAADALSDDNVVGDHALYFGSRGLREAVVRFLANAVRIRVRELWLYSDQCMEWMTEDESFRRCWSALMLACMRCGTKILIIHNIDRGLHEMTDAIAGWLPLYLSGSIESYYCSSQRGARFSNTLFICPGVACVEGGNVVGTEGAHGVYSYHTSPDALKAYGAAYKGLLARSHKLVNTSLDTLSCEHASVLEVPFDNVQVVLGADRVIVERLTEPRSTLTVLHPTLRAAFVAYAQALA